MTRDERQVRRAAERRRAGESLVDIATALRVDYRRAAALVAEASSRGLLNGSNAGAGWRDDRDRPSADPRAAERRGAVPPAASGLLDDPAAPAVVDLAVRRARRAASSCHLAADAIADALARLRRKGFRVIPGGAGFYVNGSSAAYTPAELVARARGLK